MSKLNERGARSERGSALWGTGGRGGDRSSVLWGKGGRGMVVTLGLVCALAAPLAATAGNGKGKTPAPAPAPTTTTTTTSTTSSDSSDPAPDASGNGDQSTFVAQSLRNDASNRPNTKVDVIIMASGGFQASKRVEKWLHKAAAKSDDVTDGADLSLVNGFEAMLPARLVAKLQTVPGLTIVPNATVKVSGSVAPTSSQLWPYESGNSDM
jgi:hypothetical protein